MSDHAYYLRLLEAELRGCPALYIAPVWSHVDTLEAIPAVDAPYPGLSTIAFRLVADLVGNVDIRLGSTRDFMGLADIDRQHRRLIETHQALIGIPGAASIGVKCAAWAAAFGMQGVIVERSPEDARCQALRFSRRVQATVDGYLREWLARHEALPAIEATATTVRVLQPAGELVR